ncbi:MAG: hypothetical protein V4663_15385 [Bacteroidota bacterium]
MSSYKEWMPNNPPFSNFFLKELVDGFDGLKITIQSMDKTNNEMQIYFSNYLAYRVTEESVFLKSLGEGELYKFGTTKDSEYLKWFDNESFNSFRDYKLVHYIIYGSNKVIEIIAGSKPIVNKIPQSML